MPKTQLDSSSHFYTVPVCDGQTDRQTYIHTNLYSAKNRETESEVLTHRDSIHRARRLSCNASADELHRIYRAVIQVCRSVVQVYVDVADINDNSPYFTPDSRTIQLSELSAPGTAVLLPASHDPDTTSNSVTQYQHGGPADGQPRPRHRVQLCHTVPTRRSC